LALAKLHGLTPLLYAVSAEGWLEQSLPRRDELRKAYYVNGARAVLALEELRALVGCLSALGAPVVALKGIASILSVYRDPALRVLSDLDILVAFEDLDRAVTALGKLGYRKIDRATSAEDEWLTAMFFDGICVTRPRGLPVEVHSSFLGGLGDPQAAARDVRAQAIELRGDGWCVQGLRPEHAFITAACHLHRNHARAFPYLKDVADLALLYRRIEAGGDWDSMWASARRWGVESELRGIGAFLNAYTPVYVPGCDGAAPAFRPADLVYALERLEGRGRLSEGLAARLKYIGHLPGWRARVRFIAGLAFPRPAFLRWRYHVPASQTIAPYYVRHVLRAATRTAQDLVLRTLQRRRYGSG
jgi:hypothetical protein